MSLFTLPLYPVSVVSIPLEAQCAPQWVDVAGTILAVPSECRVHPVKVPVGWTAWFIKHAISDDEARYHKHAISDGTKPVTNFSSATTTK
ncbi:hypothetical protein B0H13DRAFT_2305127 [Mycena leptocephala]|nr:hypothetical protein B0H13DRAFT_2305127 [Mycena leptocephala]